MRIPLALPRAVREARTFRLTRGLKWKATSVSVEPEISFLVIRLMLNELKQNTRSPLSTVNQLKQNRYSAIIV